ncbi:MAG: PD-(D/E)XK nuclease family protein [Ilumatobacteraceae bacterium]
MPITISTTAHGAPALDALAAAVRSAKGGDALAPVAVIVPTNTAGVMARRALGRRGGAAAIDVLTLYRVAELLGAPSLHAEGRNPVSTPVVDLAVKRVIHDTPGLYAGVNHHPSTIVALRDLYRELRIAGPGSLTALARTARGDEPARVAAEVARLLARDWYDEGDLLARAAERAAADLPARLGRVVVHLPQRLRPLEHRLLAALAEHGNVHLLLGITGDADADASVLALAEALADHPVPAGVDQVVPPIGLVTVVSTTDADDEVRIAVRAVVDAARAGTRFDRVAVLFPSDRPYARLVEHQLTAAGIPWNGRPGTTVGERMVPRVLSELLELDRRGLRRTSLMTLLGDVPARGANGRVVPTARWERIGRAAGVVRDADWATHLPRHAAEARAADRWDAEADAAAADELLAFVTELREALGDPAQVRSWATWADWAKDRLERWFGPRGLDRLDGAERVAWETTWRVLDRLHHLDAIGKPVTRAEFRATFVAELDITPARHGKVGDGVHVSTLAGSAGLDVDVAIVLGAADGLVPPAPVVDPLIGDHERAVAGLEGTDERAAAVHRQFLAAVTSTRTALVTVPRGDLRATATRHESRWVADVVAAGGPFGPPARRDVLSHAHGLAHTEFPVSAAEHRVRELWTRVRAGEDIRHGALARDDDVLRRALVLRDARASDRFTEFDGDLSSRAPFVLDRAVSPTRIETWSRCPHAYFVQYVLGVRPIDEPESIESLSALDRGTAIHAAIDRLQAAVVAGTIPAPGPDGWNTLHAEALQAAGATVSDELQAAGRTGRHAFWVNDRAHLLAQLDRWLAFDAETWAGRTIRLSERDFGRQQAVELELPGGRMIPFYGQIDRVDELPDGTLVVTDHKTGKANGLEKLSVDDPTLGGTRFQLPVYAAAARALLGRPDAPVRAEYTFFRPKFTRISLPFDDAVWKQVSEDLADVVAGIEAGVYPLIPKPPTYQHYVSCWFCEPDGLGTAVPWADWERKQANPPLARWAPELPDPPELAAARTAASTTSDDR